MVTLSGRKKGAGGVEDYVAAFVDVDFLAGVFEEQRLEGVSARVGFVDSGG